MNFRNEIAGGLLKTIRANLEDHKRVSGTLDATHVCLEASKGQGGWKTGKGCVSLRVGAMIKASSDDIYRERKERLRQHGEVAAMVKQHGSTFRGDVFL
jgi:hypothetical protein